jgi:RNA polymerase sigma-70 factor (TIGR02960 family)
MNEPPKPKRRTEPIWLEPYPDILLEDLPDSSPGPAARYDARESIELAFIVALQGLRPGERAALVLRDVLGFRTVEVADMLDTGEASVRRALRRGRAELDARLPAADRERPPRPNSARERRLVDRFADAVESADIDAVVSLLTDDARLTMPPQPLAYQGHEAIAALLRHRAELLGAPLRVVSTRANAQPAFGCYLPDPQAAIARPFGLLVLTLAGDAIAAITWFADTGLFRHFGLPRALCSLRQAESRSVSDRGPISQPQAATRKDPKEVEMDTPADRVAPGMGGRARGTIGEGEGADLRPRCAGRRTAPDATDGGGERLSLRGP